MTKQEWIAPPTPVAARQARRGKDRDPGSGPSALPRRSPWPATLGFLVCVAAPTLLAATYWWGIAADRYVTEIRYSVRGGATLSDPEGKGGVLGGSGALVYAADSFVLEDYVSSVAALKDLDERVALRAMLGRDGDDPIRRYDPDAPLEDLLTYWEGATDVYFDATTGITTLTVSMFTPEDAEAAGEALVAELKAMIDGLSAESRQQMLQYIYTELDFAREALDTTRADIEAFRRSNQVISPADDATLGSTIIATLTQRLADRRVELRALIDRTPGSPRIPVLRNEIEALDAQLRSEIERRGGGEAQTAQSLPSQLSNYEELQSAYEIARETYVNTVKLKQQAEAYATLGQAELVVFVQPRAPTLSTAPNRLLETAKVFGLTLAVWLIARILLASIRH